MDHTGLIMIYTGNGKGKTTAALGLALRAMGHGKRVFIMQFMKGSKEYGEVKIAGQLPLLTLVQSGLESFVIKGAPSAEDLRLARRGLDLAWEAVKSGQYELIILDEINVALDYDLVPLAEVLELLKTKPAGLDLVLTGRYVPEGVLELADLISEVKEVRHHYNSGVQAREGMEF
ncbi:MAG TPA: cob(I)yrinic acid a,c-diamide adenosyltransferase [Verrucomicrobiae bacterium]|nr:cob(I)yrinic acid a,c-diamide adenosyltransferase [Verrucomicrobiae bacterium]